MRIHGNLEPTRSKNFIFEEKMTLSSKIISDLAVDIEQFFASV